MKYVLFALLFLVFFVSCNDGSRSYKDIDEIEIEGRSTLSWDDASRVKIAPLEGESGSCFSYPRLEELPDGTLLAVYEDCSGGRIILKRSGDGGLSWGEGFILFSRRDNINPAVPEIILLDDGTLLSAANYRPVQPYSSDRRFGISVKRSADNGYSWSGEDILYEGGWTYENGCWEPVFLQLPSGEVHLFFADETPYADSDDQNISMLRSYDRGKSWTEAPEIVSYRWESRDGMPVPLYMEDQQKVLLAIEDKHIGAFKPSVLHERGASWDEHVNGSDIRRDYHPLVAELPKDTYAGAPYLERLHTDEVILSVQTNFKRGGDWTNSIQMVLVGDSTGAAFAHPSYPFPLGSGKRAMWNSLEVLSDGTVLAASATTGYSASGKQEIWLARGSVKAVR